MRLWLREAVDETLQQVEELIAALLKLANRYPDAVIPGYTHLRRAQAVLGPHYLLAYVEMLFRDHERLQQARKRINVMPAGLRRPGRQRLPPRSRGDRQRPRL